MRDASKLILTLAVAAGLTACNKPANENNVVTVDNDAATPADVEALPPDESSATPSNELANGDDNPDVNDVNATANTGD
jgi:hypothetical protein